MKRIQKLHISDSGVPYLVASALLTTALLKLSLLMPGSNIAKTIDPVFDLPFGALASLALLLELASAVLLITRKWRALGWYVCAGTMTTFGIYRIGVLVTGYALPCSCLGILPDWIGISNGAADRLAIMILVVVAGIAVYQIINQGETLRRHHTIKN